MEIQALGAIYPGNLEYLQSASTSAESPDQHLRRASRVLAAS